MLHYVNRYNAAIISIYIWAAQRVQLVTWVLIYFYAFTFSPSIRQMINGAFLLTNIPSVNKYLHIFLSLRTWHPRLESSTAATRSFPNTETKRKITVAVRTGHVSLFIGDNCEP